LILHARLTQRDAEAVRNLDLLGSRSTKPLKDTTPPLRQLFPQRPPPKPSSNDPDNDDSNVSRYEPCLKKLLEEHIAGTLDQEFFPSTQPTPDGNASPDVPTPNSQNNDHLLQSQSSLRSSKPTWARSRTAGSHPGSALARDSSGDETRNRKNDQRILVFMAGGATYSELRSCYEVSNNPQVQKEVFLLTTHMLSPALWCRQLADLSLKRERLGLPVDRPKKAAPRHLWEDEPKKSPAGGATPTGPRTPAQAATPSSRNGATPASAQTPASAGSGKSHHLPFGKSKKQGGPTPASAPGSGAGSYNSASAGPGYAIRID
ncbi:vacuolar sorting protein VPS33/slp1, partial [Ascosphaera atra]